MPKFQGARRDPFQVFKFRVIVAGYETACFQTVTGLSEETEIVEYREGCDTITVRKLPGLVSYDDITLTKGLSPNDDFVRWRRDVVNITQQVGETVPADGLPPDQFRRPVRIELYDRAGALAKAWELLRAWPSQLEIGDLNAESSDVLIETLTIAHEGIIHLPGSATSTEGILNPAGSGAAGGLEPL